LQMPKSHYSDAIARYNALSRHLSYIIGTAAPAGGEAAAAPERVCARMPVGTYLYLHAVGAGNPVAVSCLAR
jgi:hypothetical protein